MSLSPTQYFFGQEKRYLLSSKLTPRELANYNLTPKYLRVFRGWWKTRFFPKSYFLDNLNHWIYTDPLQLTERRGLLWCGLGEPNSFEPIFIVWRHRTGAQQGICSVVMFGKTQLYLWGCESWQRLVEIGQVWRDKLLERENSTLVKPPTGIIISLQTGRSA